MKDFQQLRVIEQINLDLHLGAKIVRCQTVREINGLALSSRNDYLPLEDRLNAPKLYKALQNGKKLLKMKPKMSPAKIRSKVKSSLSTIPRTKLDYVELVDPQTLQRVSTPSRPVLIAAAVKFRNARLIDNILVT